MIQFDKISLGFLGHTLFENVSFFLQQGEKCGLIGRNGSGKSTIFKLISGEIMPDKGSITYPKNYKIGYLQQQILFTANSLLEEATKSLPNPEQDLVYKAEKILFGLGFTKKDLHSHPKTFSGGFHIRLHLAKVLISEPDCLLLDEPTNYLDILSIRWLKQFLGKWQKEFILISHDREFVDSVTTHTLGIYRQKVRKMNGSSLNFFQQMLLEEEVHEKTRVKLEKKKEQIQNFVDRFGAKATKAAQARSKKKILEKEPVFEKLNQIAELFFCFHEAPFQGKKLLEAKQLHFSYNPNKPLIQNFSIAIEKGERVAIIGKNGQGKSTLLRLLGGELASQQGKVDFSDNLRIGYFGQTHVEKLNDQHTIEQEISLSNTNLNYNEIKKIAGLMMFCGPLSEKKISILSGGEKSRVLLGKILAKACNLLLLDEPTHHLDIESIEALLEALEKFAGAVLIVTHSELILRRLDIDKMIVCKDSQQLIFSGNYDAFLKEIGWDEEKKTQPPKEKLKDRRREKAEWIAKRAATLKPIEEQIKIAEKVLISLEKAQKKDQGLIESGLTDPVVLKSLGLRQKQIIETENELYELYALLEKKKAEFIQQRFVVD